MCFIWCMSYTVGMSIICFLNIALSCFTLFKQVPDFLNWDSANGFMSKNKPSSRLIYGMAAAHVLCIVLSLFWFVKTILFDSDSLWTRQIMIVVQWLYVFANFVLADEINRAPAKVQSALLEAMQEKQVTIGTQT